MTALLVSVRDRDEARLCLAAGVDLIDVKEPAGGPLGRARAETLAGVLDESAGRRPVSAALGELADWPEGEVPAEVSRLRFVKWGLSRCGDDWRDRLARLRGLVEGASPCQVVVTCYADARRAGSPAPDDVCHHAVATRAAVLLIDTWGKDGTRLPDWMPPHALDRTLRACRDGGVRVALGGSLGRRDIETLLPLRPDWIAVRGAACVGGRRDGPLDAEAVAALVALTRPTPEG